MMQQVIRGLKQPPFIVRIPHLSTLSARIVIILLLVVSFSTAVVVVSAMAQRYGQAYQTDPFAAFVDYFPGHPVDMRLLEARGFSCRYQAVLIPADLGAYCWRSLAAGPFSWVYVTIWDGIVKRLDFDVHANSLAMGDLVLLWGRPQLIINGNFVNVSWRAGGITRGLGWSQNERFAYFQPLSLISFGT
jgi:hypothetical protein